MVYLAFDPILEREVALKVPKSKASSDPDRADRFLREAKSAARLRHPHIAAVFDCGQDGEHYYIATAFIEGNSLDNAIDLKSIGFVETAKIVRSLAEALAYAHGQGIIHRDIKPANIMLDANRAPYLVDFGLAARLDSGSSQSSDDAGDFPSSEDADPKLTQIADARITTKRRRMGTPAYMSPEQAAGILENVKEPTDQYSLGMVLYEMLCGQTAFSGPPALLHSLAQTTPPPPPRGIKPEIPEDLEAICLKTLAKQPSERYANCQGLADDLRRWLDGEETHARPQPTKERIRRWCKQEPIRAWAVGLAAVAALAVLILSVLVTQQSRSNERVTKRLLASATLDRAKDLGEQNETGLALLWLARGLSIAEGAGADDLAHTIRRNLAAWSRSMHSLRSSISVETKALAVQFHPDGTKLYIGGESALLQISLTPKGDFDSVPIKIEGEQKPVSGLAFANNREQLLFAMGKTIYRNGPKQEPLCEAKSDIRAIATILGQIAFVDVEGRAWLLSTDEGLFRLLKGEGGQNPNAEKVVSCLAFSPCGKAILLGCADGEALIWSVESRRVEQRIPGVDRISAVAYHPDGTRILLARSTELSGRGELWSVADTRKPLATFPHQAEVHAVAFSPCGQVMVTAGRDRAARLWDVESFQQVGRTLWHPAEVKHATFHPTKQAIVTVDTQRTVRLWEIRQEPRKPKFRPPFLPVTAINANAEGTIFLVQAGDTVHVEHDDGQKMGVGIKPNLFFHKPGRFNTQVTAFDVHEKTKRLLTASMFKPQKENEQARYGIHLWDTNNPTPLCAFHGPIESVFRVAMSPDGQTVASVSKNGMLLVWNVDNEMVPLLEYQTNGKLFALAFSPDGTRLVIGGTDHQARVFEVKNLKKTPILFEHPDSVLSAAFSPDGQHLLVGFAGGAQLWSLNDKKAFPLQHLTGTFAVGFSPEGRTMVTAGTDRKAYLWDVATRKRIGPPLLHPGPVFAAVLTKEFLATSTFPSGKLHGTTVHHWPMYPPSEVASDELLLRAKLSANIDLDEHDTNQVIGGVTWSQLRTQVKHPENWQVAWEDWPTERIKPMVFRAKQVPLPKVDQGTGEKKVDPKPKIDTVKVDPVQTEKKKDLLPKIDPIKPIDTRALQGQWTTFQMPANKLSADPEAFFPDDVSMIVQLDLAQVRRAKLQRETVEQLESAMQRARSEDVGALLAFTDRIFIGATNEWAESMVVIMDGRFRWIQEAAMKAGGLQAGSVPVLEVQGGKCFALLNDKTIVGAMSRDSLERTLRRAADPKRKPLSVELAEVRKRAKANPILHIAATVAFIDRHDNDKFASKAGIEAVSGTVMLDDKLVKLEILASSKDAKSAQDLTAFAKLMAPQVEDRAKTQMQFQPLADAMGTFSAEAKGRHVELRMDLPIRGFDQLLSNILPK